MAGVQTVREREKGSKMSTNGDKRSEQRSQRIVQGIYFSSLKHVLQQSKDSNLCCNLARVLCR